MEVVTLVNKGMSYKEVASVRGGAEDSVKELMGKIALRLNVKGKENILLKLNSYMQDAF